MMINGHSELERKKKKNTCKNIHDSWLPLSKRAKLSRITQTLYQFTRQRYK